MITKTLLATLALATLVLAPLATAGTQLENLPRLEQIGKDRPKAPGARIEWSGDEARGESIGALRMKYAGSSVAEVDERCVGTLSAGLESIPRETLVIPTKHKGATVVGSRITTDLGSPSTVLCLVIVKDGEVVHRGLVGKWSTPGTFEPGVYTILIGAPGAYRFSVEVDLVAP